MKQEPTSASTTLLGPTALCAPTAGLSSLHCGNPSAAKHGFLSPSGLPSLRSLPVLQMRGPSVEELRPIPKCRKLHLHVQMPLHLTGNLFPSHHTCQTSGLTRSSSAESRWGPPQGELLLALATAHRMDRWTDRWTDGWMDRQMDKRMDRGHSALITRPLSRLGKCPAAAEPTAFRARLSPCFTALLLKSRICIDFRTTQAVNYWPRSAW